MTIGFDFTPIDAWHLLVFLEIARNWYIIEKKNRRPTYWKSTLGRIASGLAFWSCTPWLWPDLDYWRWLGMIPMMLFSFWFCFDYGLNIVRRKRPVWYLNPTGSLLDRLQCKYPHAYPWFWWKLFFMAGGISLYYYGLNAIWTGV